MILVIYILAFSFTVLSLAKHIHTDWLLKNSIQLRYELENAETKEERLQVIYYKQPLCLLSKRVLQPHRMNSYAEILLLVCAHHLSYPTI